MSSKYGATRQLGLIVADIDKAMQEWVDKLGVGPWFVKRDIGITEFTYQGSPLKELPTVSIALAYSGDLQVELIQPTNGAPSMWSDSLKQHGDCPQHIAFWTDEYEELHSSLTSDGFVEGHYGRAGSRGRFAYFTHPQMPEIVIELSESTGGKKEYFAKIKAASLDWDGTDPIRWQDQ